LIYFKEMFTRIGFILKTTPRRSKSSEPLLALQVRQVAKESLGKILREYPEDLDKKIKVKSFKNGVLVVIAPSLLSAELHTRSEGLKKDINKGLAKKVVEKIRFRSS